MKRNVLLLNTYHVLDTCTRPFPYLTSCEPHLNSEISIIGSIFLRLREVS